MKKKTGLYLMLLLMMTAFSFFFVGRPAQAAVKLNQKTLYLTARKTYKLKVKGTKKKVTWKTSNKKVAVVSKNGKVTAKKIGKATIVAKVNGKKYKCKIYVEKKVKNNFRKLRDFVVKKGKKYKDGEGKVYYQIENLVTDEEQTEYRSRISAYKDSYKMSFVYTVVPDTTAGYNYSFKFSIDLTKKTSGSLEVSKGSMADYEGYYCSGSINTAFDGKGAGVNITSYTDIDSVGNETNISNPGTMSSNVGAGGKDAFIGFDTLLKAKKAGVTMRTIGFTKYK